ncbi:uncharacterized protein LOC118082278 isoform X1 [Zootoca vivipara]|uniref:uncharacterized protein LOC118082278 isoform X1 n=1 Tax=Zootoca vivipara TaxID=8524 RepID=UPI00293BA5DA|nr:uncharacterized protein LOC118082278 isoform X1 [Zootoca vivipara]
MAPRRKQKESAAAPPKKRRATGKSYSGTPSGTAISIPPEAVATLFSGFQSFFQQVSKPGVTIQVVPPVGSPDFIAETPMAEAARPGPSSANTPEQPRRVGTRSQSAPADAATSSAGDKAPSATAGNASIAQLSPGTPACLRSQPLDSHSRSGRSSITSYDSDAQDQVQVTPSQQGTTQQVDQEKGKAKKTGQKKSKKTKRKELEDDSDGPLPLSCTRGSAVARGVPGTSMESWERDVIEGVLASVAPSTLSTYKKAWSDFRTFRARTLGSEMDTPPNKREVLAYLVNLRRLGRAARTLHIQTAAISFFSKASYSTDPCADFLVRKALEGWRRLQPPRKDSRKPITFNLLFQIHKQLRKLCWSKYEARLFSAAYSIAFFGAFRIGEVVCEGSPSQAAKGILLSDLSLSEKEVVIHIRQSKTDQCGRGALMRLPATGHPGPCPVKDTRRFLHLRPASPGPFLIHQDGSCLARHQFTRVMRKAIAACGLPPSDFAAHSFRIGAATTAVHMGLSVDRIKDLGRWKSKAYKGYLRSSK